MPRTDAPQGTEIYDHITGRIPLKFEGYEKPFGVSRGKVDRFTKNGYDILKEEASSDIVLMGKKIVEKKVEKEVKKTK